MTTRNRKIIAVLMALTMSGCNGCNDAPQESSSSVREEQEEKTPEVVEEPRRDEVVAENNKKDVSDGQKRLDNMVAYGIYDYSEVYEKVYENSEKASLKIADDGLKGYACRYDNYQGGDETVYRICGVTGIEKITGQFGDFTVPEGESGNFYLPYLNNVDVYDNKAGHMYKTNVSIKMSDGFEWYLEDVLITITDEPVPMDAVPVVIPEYIKDVVYNRTMAAKRWFGEGYTQIRQTEKYLYIPKETGSLSKDEMIEMVEEEILDNLYIPSIREKEIEYEGIKKVDLTKEGTYEVIVCVTNLKGNTSRLEQYICVY